MFALRAFRQQPPGLPHLLNFERLIEPGVVKTKSGGYLAGWYYRGPDLASSTVRDRNYLTERINACLARFGAGWVTWMDAVRLEAPAYADRGHFPDPVTALIDEERRTHCNALGTQYESEYALLVMYEPPEKVKLDVDKAFYIDDMPSGAPTVNRELKLVQLFKRVLGEIEDQMGDVVRMQRMGASSRPGVAGKQVTHDELLGYLQFCITGVPRPFVLPSCPMYLDALLGGQDLIPGETPKIGDHFIGCVSIDGMPLESHPNMLDSLDKLAMPYRWSSRMIYLDRQEALARINAFKRKWKQKQRSFFSQVFNVQGAVNEDAVAMAQSASEAVRDASDDFVTFGYYTATVVLHGRDRNELDEACRSVVRLVQRMGFGARRETVNTMQAWHGAVPGHPQPNVRQPLIHTLNFADLVPLASVWPGLPTCPCPYFPPDSPPLLQASTAGATPFRLNLHVSDLGHTLIFGPTGAGKSSLVSLICAQYFRYPRAQILAFDKGRSLMPLAKSVGAAHYDLASDGSTLRLCPLQSLDTEADIAWANEWLGDLYQLQTGTPPLPIQRAEIYRALNLLRRSSTGRTLTGFCHTVQDEEVRQALSYYTLDGPMGYLLDGDEDNLQLSRFTVFETSELLKLGDRVVLPVLAYLFRRIDKTLDGRPTLIPIAEAWSALGHEVFRGKIKEWLKELRKANAALLPDTQSLADAVRSGIFDVLVEACPTKILLPNPEATTHGTSDVPGPADLYAAMGLNEVERELLRTATPKRDYYYTSPEGRRLFNLELGPVALSFVGATGKEDLQRIEVLCAEHGEAWPFVWMDERGVDYERYLHASAP